VGRPDGLNFPPPASPRLRHRPGDAGRPGGAGPEVGGLDFAAFRAEVKKVFGIEIPLKERGDWEAWLAESAAEVRRLSAEIAQAEREIDAIVYRLFNLTPDEIALLEASIAGQH
jgi:hypothetical protein